MDVIDRTATALRIGQRLPATPAEVERLRCYVLRTFARAHVTADAALESYIVDLTGEVFGPLLECNRRWRRWGRRRWPHRARRASRCARPRPRARA